MPATGHDGWTQYFYTRASSATDRANVVVRRRANGSKSAAVLARDWYFFQSDVDHPEHRADEVHRPPYRAGS